MKLGENSSGLNVHPCINPNLKILFASVIGTIHVEIITVTQTVILLVMGDLPLSLCHSSSVDPICLPNQAVSKALFALTT